MEEEEEEEENNKAGMCQGKEKEREGKGKDLQSIYLITFERGKEKTTRKCPPGLPPGVEESEREKLGAKKKMQ